MQIEKKPFNSITKDELLKLLGINILIGIKRLPLYRNYWLKNE